MLCLLCFYKSGYHLQPPRTLVWLSHPGLWYDSATHDSGMTQPPRTLVWLSHPGLWYDSATQDSGMTQPPRTLVWLSHPGLWYDSVTQDSGMTLVDKIWLKNSLYSSKNTPIVVLLYSLKTSSLPQDSFFFKNFFKSDFNYFSITKFMVKFLHRVGNIWQINFTVVGSAIKVFLKSYRIHWRVQGWGLYVFWGSSIV